MTVYLDAVKLESEQFGKRRLLGWFADEVAAISAAAERAMKQSAIVAELRQLPELIICTEYLSAESGHSRVMFKRATRVKRSKLGRRFIMSPGAWGKIWMKA